MRWIIAISLTLAALGLLALCIDLPGIAIEFSGQSAGWRRTADGWERASSLIQHMSSNWERNFALAEPHPVVISLLMGLLSTLSLAAFAPSKRCIIKPITQRPKFIRVKAAAGQPQLDISDWLDNPRLR